MNLILLLLLLVAMIAIGLPIGFALIGATAVMIAFDPGASLMVVPLRLFHGTDSFTMVAVPLFMLAGALMNRAGISGRLIELAGSLVGWVRGGLAMTTTVTSMFFSEVSGSAVADAAALGSVLVPAMKRKGYPAPFAAAVLSSSATIAIVIPPSIPMILYGAISGTSIARLFLAGVIPGLLVGGAIMITSAVQARVQGFADREPFSLPRVAKATRRAFLSLSLPLIVLGGIFTGYFTATEAAAIAVAAAIVIGVLHGELRFRDLVPACRETGYQTGVVMILVAGSAVLGWYLSNEQVPTMIADTITTHVSGRVATLLVLNGALLVAGMFLHSAAAIVLLVPIFMPLAERIGLDPVHFGLIITLNLAIGQQTPPVASVLMTACSISGAPLGEVVRANTYFVLAMVVVLLLVTFFPAICLWLPGLFAT